MKRRKTLVAAALLGLSLSLVGCATPATQDAQKAEAAQEQQTPNAHYSFEEKLPDGRTVLCIWASESYNSGGLSCDWESLAKEER
jgi:hypothetical protein